MQLWGAVEQVCPLVQGGVQLVSVDFQLVHLGCEDYVGLPKQCPYQYLGQGLF